MAGVKGQKSGGHSTAGTGAGRPTGKTKTANMLGYKYTDEEVVVMKKSLSKLKEQYGTTSKGLFEILKNYLESDEK